MNFCPLSFAISCYLVLISGRRMTWLVVVVGFTVAVVVVNIAISKLAGM
jgi:hypothetical protein